MAKHVPKLNRIHLETKRFFVHERHEKHESAIMFACFSWTKNIQNYIFHNGRSLANDWFLGGQGLSVLSACVANGKQNRPRSQAELFGHGELLVGLAVTLALHAAWILQMPATAQHTTWQPPKPISVQWLSSPRAHTEPAKQPAPPKPNPKQAKSAVKTKLQPPKTAAKPLQPLIKSSQKAIEATSPNPIAATAKPPAPLVAVAPTAPAPPAPAKASVADTTPVTLPHLNADYLDNPAPHYPPASRELGEQGRVLVRVMVSADGRVAQVALRKSSGFGRLDQAALDSVKHWRFVPAQRGGQQITAWVVVPVAFSLEG